MAEFNIRDFRGSINKEGVLLQNKFLMTVTPPKKLNLSSTKNITLRCDSVNLPGKALLTEDLVYRHGYGLPERIPYGSQFQDVTATYMLDREAAQLKFFNDWSELIHGTDSSRGLLNKNQSGGSAYEVEYKSNYATTVSIYVYNDKSKNAIECTLYEAFPQMIQDKQLSWGEAEVLKVGIGFYYRNAKIKTSTTMQSLLNTFSPENLFGDDMRRIQRDLSRIF